MPATLVRATNHAPLSDDKWTRWMRSRGVAPPGVCLPSRVQTAPTRRGANVARCLRRPAAGAIPGARVGLPHPPPEERCFSPTAPSLLLPDDGPVVATIDPRFGATTGSALRRVTVLAPTSRPPRGPRTKRTSKLKGLPNERRCWSCPWRESQSITTLARCCRCRNAVPFVADRRPWAPSTAAGLGSLRTTRFRALELV